MQLDPTSTNPTTATPITGPNAPILAQHEWITEKEACVVARFSRSMLHRSGLPKYKLGGKTLYRSSEVKALLSNLPVASHE
jgi:hypothetical protein